MKTGRDYARRFSAMRGMFTCGVIDVFLEQGITFDGAAGISAGASLSCNFKSVRLEARMGIIRNIQRIRGTVIMESLPNRRSFWCGVLLP